MQCTRVHVCARACAFVCEKTERARERERERERVRERGLFMNHVWIVGEQVPVDR